MPTLNGMVTPDENLNLTKFIFYTTGSKIAANFTKNHEERFTELKEMIEKEEKLEKFVKVDQVWLFSLLFFKFIFRRLQ